MSNDAKPADPSSSGARQAESRRRMIELARKQAFVKHSHYVLMADTQGHVQGMNDKEWGFSACPHPDCAALRACADALAPSAEKVQETHEDTRGDTMEIPERLLTASQNEVVTTPALNHEGEPLHTGDDERIDLVSSIIASAEEIEGDDTVTDCAATIIADCHKLDALLLATIQRERLRADALAPSPEPDRLVAYEVPDEQRTVLIDYELSRGAPVMDFTLADGRIVQITRDDDYCPACDREFASAGGNITDTEYHLCYRIPRLEAAVSRANELLDAALAENKRLRADALAPPEPGWQPMTAVSPAREAELWFWIRPKTADETYHDTSGKPILSATPPRLFIGKRGTWPSLMTATHWMKPRWPAPPRADALEAPPTTVAEQSVHESCQCPAKPGEPCPLNESECASRVKKALAVRYLERAAKLSGCSWNCYAKYVSDGFDACCSNCQNIALAMVDAMTDGRYLSLRQLASDAGAVL